jgi:hypothetical protein
LTANQIGRQRRQLVIVIVRPAIFNRDVPAFDESGFGQAIAERGDKVRGTGCRRAPEKTDHRHRWLLRARAASGHATAAPPMSVMNSRPLTASASRA